MERSLGYLRESLSNWTDTNETARQLYSMIETQPYESNATFIEDLGDEEKTYLQEMIRYEMNYAKNERDKVRYDALNSIFRLMD
jgi:hypothetical protein